MNINRELIEVLSWKIISEFMRCFPGKFKIIETHPGGGQYDCLSVLDSNHNLFAHFNRQGSLKINYECDPITMEARREIDKSVDIWKYMVVRQRSIKRILSHVLDLFNLKLPKPRPPSNPEMLVYRLISNVLTYSLFSGNHWKCRNGFLDSSGEESEVCTLYFTNFPDAKSRLESRLPDDILGIAAYRFWFLINEKGPVACLETGGNLWTVDGKQFKLYDIYKHDHRMWYLINKTMGSLLP